MDIATRIGPYATVMILGPANSGKSHLARHLLNLLNPQTVATIDTRNPVVPEAPFVLMEDSCWTFSDELRWSLAQLSMSNRHKRMTLIYVAQRLEDMNPLVRGNTDMVILMGGLHREAWMKGVFTYLRDYFGSYEEFRAAIPLESFKALIVDRRRRGGPAELHTAIYEAPPPPPWV